VNIDIHTHFIAEEFIDLLIKNPARYQARIETANGQRYIYHDQGYSYPLNPGFHDLKARIADMDSRGIDIDIISVAPPIYYYWADSELGLEVARLHNDSACRMVKSCPDRLQAMATVPMQDVKLAMGELERAVVEHGFKYVEIGTTIEGRNLDEPEYLPFFKKAEDLGVSVMFHPYYVGYRHDLKDYYLTNLIGNPLDTTICISRLVLGGVMEKCPALKFIFVHGGGYIPYQRGRLQHGYQVREEAKAVLSDGPPAGFFDNLYYDTITHWGPALKYLIESHSADKIMLGSDYPFDMADPDPVKSVKALNLDQKVEEMILGLNAKNFF